MSKLLTIKELCERIGFSRRLVDNLRKEGKIPFYKFSGKMLRYDPDEVLAALRAASRVIGEEPKPASEPEKVTPRKKRKTPQPEEEKGRPPIHEGCEHFRISEHQKKLVLAKYAQLKVPTEIIPKVISVVDAWLASDTSRAIRARATSSHYRQLYAPWAIEGAARVRDASGIVGTQKGSSDRAAETRKRIEEQTSRVSPGKPMTMAEVLARNPDARRFVSKETIQLLTGSGSTSIDESPDSENK